MINFFILAFHLCISKHFCFVRFLTTSSFNFAPAFMPVFLFLPHWYPLWFMFIATSFWCFSEVWYLRLLKKPTSLVYYMSPIFSLNWDKLSFSFQYKILRKQTSHTHWSLWLSAQETLSTTSLRSKWSHLFSHFAAFTFFFLGKVSAHVLATDHPILLLLLSIKAASL